MNRKNHYVLLTPKQVRQLTDIQARHGMDDNMPGALIGQPFLYTGALGQGPGILHVRYYTAVEANANQDCCAGSPERIGYSLKRRRLNSGMSRTLIIVIPDEAPLSWNEFYAGKFWRARKDAADRAHMLVKSCISPDEPPFTTPVFIRYDAYSKRPLDADNIASKLYTDGIVYAGLLTGDDWRRVVGVACYSHKAQENELHITITEVTE